MRHRHLLDPLHPHRIVDMPKLIDVPGRGGQREFEDGCVGHVSVIARSAATKQSEDMVHAKRD